MKVKTIGTSSTADQHNAMTRSTNYRCKRARRAIRPPQQDECMGQDNGSIDTQMGVREMQGTCTMPLHTEAGNKAFVIPTGLSDERRMNDDDISVLTEFSGMDEEEDACSQVTATSWTVVTTSTDSTTIPTTNTTLAMPQPRTKRRNLAFSENVFAQNNTPFKRRRKR